MSLISNKSFIEEEEQEVTSSYKLPTLVTKDSEEIPFGKAVGIATALHPGVVCLIWLISILLMFLGIDWLKFDKVKLTPKRDIEFVLVDKPAPPRDKNTKYRADMDSRSGGINDPKRKVSMPSPPPQKVKKPSSAAQSSNNLIKKQQQKAAQTAVQQPKKVEPQKQAQPQQAKPSAAKPAPPTARPSIKPAQAPSPVAKPSTPFTVPVPNSAPVGKTLSTGPVGGTSTPGATSRSGSSGSTSGNYAPRPSLSPSSGGGSGQLSRGTSGGGTGNVGNPGGGGGAPGIDALREPDFGPYMRELQRRIKLNWDPPKGNESKTVVLLFKIAKDGRLLSCKISRSSGLPSADQAALKAVELTAPFKPLPADFKGQNIDIQFTFDYRVFGASRSY